MASVEASPSEKFRRLMEAYQIEMEYGRTMSSYKQTLADGREAEMVRLGRVTLLYRTVEGGETGYWDNAEQGVGRRSGFGRADRGGAQHRQRGERLRTSSRCPCPRRKEADREQRREQSPTDLVGALAIASLLAAASVAAQQRQAAPAQPTRRSNRRHSGAAQAAAQPQRSNARRACAQAVNRLRDQERQLAREREQRFRAELQRVERQAQEAVDAA